MKSSQPPEREEVVHPSAPLVLGDGGMHPDALALHTTSLGLPNGAGWRARLVIALARCSPPALFPRLRI